MRASSHALPYVISSTAILLTWGSHVALRRRMRWLDRATTAGLAVVALLAGIVLDGGGMALCMTGRHRS